MTFHQTHSVTKNLPPRLILLSLCFCGLICCSFMVSAQKTEFKVDDSVPIATMVKSLEGKGVEIFNISFNNIHTDNRPNGTFKDVLGLLDIGEGLIMTSGGAKVAVGPNNKSNAGRGDGTSAGEDFDLNLASIVSGEKFYDLNVIEFDIRVNNTVLSFNYMFGSEEYPEYEREYNDVFGFFITGPGINGVKNLAVIGDKTPVSVKSINSTKNSSYFVSNGGGDNPAQDFYLQYDGFTKKLVAKTEVVPCQVYHIKLAIADARDDILDSGVFIEKGSFSTSSKLDVDVEFEHQGIDYAVEGCNKGYFVVKKNLEWLSADEPVTLEFQLSGSSTNGTDYPLISGNTITIPANEESIKIEIDALLDGIPEGPENVTLDIVLKCGGSIIATASADMIIQDKFDFPMKSEVCKDVLMPINTDASDRFVFTWAADPALSCTTCPSPSVTLSNDAQFAVHVKDTESGCETDTQADVTIQTIDAYFKYVKDNNYTSVDAFFENLSEGADTYEWDFGDGSTSTLFEPKHTFVVEESRYPADPRTYTIRLNVSSFQGLCRDQYDTTIVVQPLFIPNVITPNNDVLNNQFVVNGIENGTWKIKIYNRWGGLVYSSNHYNNDWEGRNVSNGVYYFKLSNQKGDREFKGWVQVLR